MTGYILYWVLTALLLSAYLVIPVVIFYAFFMWFVNWMLDRL